MACAIDGFKEVPDYIKNGLKMRADAVNMPRIGHPENFYWPSVQVNVATAERNDSGMSSHPFILHNAFTTK